MGGYLEILRGQNGGFIGQATLSRLVLQGREEVERIYTECHLDQQVVVKDEMRYYRWEAQGKSAYLPYLTTED